MSSRPSRGAARLAAILDALPDALLLVNANGTVVNANAIALETFEAPGTALVGRGLLDLLPAFDSRRIPGSMRRPDSEEDRRTKPTRMVARRTDGSEFPVEVTSANLEDGRTPYADPHHLYTGDELLMLVVRDLTGTMDTEAELARQQRQTEMILRAASEGVVGVDTEGKVVLVNPAAAQILGFRASDLGGQELHPLIHHSRADGSALPWEETPLADTLRSGRKHRVRGQVLWTKNGRPVPVDLTTAPVREGDQLVGAVMSFTDRSRFDALAARHAQLREVLDASLRAPLDELRTELSGLAADPAGQLWPEANQTLHHLAAGYARMTALIDNVLAFQRLDAGKDKLEKAAVGLDDVVAAGVEGAIDLIGPGRAQYAVHAPPIQAVVDGPRLSQALAHLIADVAGVDATGRTSVVAGGGDSTIVVAAAQRGEVVRIEVRGPHSGGSPVHLPITRGIVERHGGVLQTHEVPGQGGSAYVLEVPVGEGGGEAAPGKAVARDSETTVLPMPSAPARGTQGTAARPKPQEAAGQSAGRTPRPRRPVDESNGGSIALPAGPSASAAPQDQPTGRRRALRRAEPGGIEQPPGPDDVAVNGTNGSNAAGPQAKPTGRRARRALAEGQQPELPPARPAAHALPPAQSAEPELAEGLPAAPQPEPGRPALPALPEQATATPRGRRARALPEGTGPQQPEPLAIEPALPSPDAEQAPRPSGRRARKPAAEPESPGSLPPATDAVDEPVHQGPPQGEPQSPAQAARPAPYQANGQQNPSGWHNANGTPQAAQSPQSEGRAISVRTLGQGVAYVQPGQTPPAGQPAVGGGSGRRRKLTAPPQPQAGEPARQHPTERAGASNPAFQASDSQGEGQAFAIGAPAEGDEGPEHLDGPNGAVEVSAAPAAPAAEADGVGVELSSPRRLLVWPEPDVSTRQALTDRGYRPVTVRSREEVDAQVAEYPAALFVDPLTGPITRTALQSLRAAAVAAEVPVLVTAGLGQATREAAYGADPAVLLKALAPRDSEQHPPRVLLVESHRDIAAAFTATLERRGMQVAHAASEGDAATLAAQMRPNLVVMDLMLIRRRRVGIVDWLRANGLLNRTPLVVYTSVDIEPAELPRLGSGETVLFLAERSTSAEVQGRIVDLLSKIGAEA
ncbi:PAS domain-containing protein [Streptantibioticus rubrisoli]|uniref:PAS domain-containing protein n=1 Tax=Streptantibioticus rubrisoli TaxID=1387313 RepID=A0ABT1PCD0_9ACTN|nr:PAS domain-containing protein [Streptantibioticus rubrisoli]MCQ4043025.1 PAS domain-containing protein [Streptantibioticus rubrisoli]